MKPYTLSRFILCLIVFLVAFSPLNASNGGKKNGKVKTTHANGTKASQGKVKNYQKQGTWKYWNEKGVFVKAATYKNDVLNGEYVELYDGKQKATQGNYLNGQRNGNWNEWYTDGKSRSRLYYVNGQFNGTQQYWFENNNLREEAVYENGILKSRKTWYYNGRPRKTEYYQNGKREGQWREYYEFATDTLPTLVQTYSNDLLNGPLYRYSKGRRTEEANYLNGRLNGTLRRWDDYGNLGLEENYSSGQLNGESRYWENGILLRSGNFLNGAKNGQFTENNRQGQLLRHTWYTRGREDSAHSFHPNGKIAIRKTSILGITLTETYQEFDEAGQLMLEGNYMNKIKQGVWTSYYPNGKKKSETRYDLGVITGNFLKWYPNGNKLLEAECINGNVKYQPKVWTENGRLIPTKDKLYKSLVDDNLPREIVNNPDNYWNKMKIRFVEPEVAYEPEENDTQDGFALTPPSGDDFPGNYETGVAEAPDCEIFKVADVMPEFPGGNDSLQLYLKRSIRYPLREKDEKIEGTVYIRFTVLQDGSINYIEVEKDVPSGPGLTKEAIRVIQRMPKWKPGKINGKPVCVETTISIKFKLSN
jgi:TonB family protein